MASTKDFLFSNGRFEFRGKIYKLKYAHPKPSITMVAEDGSTISFAEGSRISKEFKLIFSQQILDGKLYYDIITPPIIEYRIAI